LHFLAAHFDLVRRIDGSLERVPVIGEHLLGIVARAGNQQPVVAAECGELVLHVGRKRIAQADRSAQAHDQYALCFLLLCKRHD
jgi:hypothetical protein